VTYRRRGNPLAGFSFGGRIQPGLGLILAIAVVLTVLVFTVRPAAQLLALSPGPMVLGGELWRLVSWSLVAASPFELLFGGLVLWMFVPQVSYRWSTGRLLAIYLGYAAGASVVTAVVAFLLPSASGLAHLGWWPVLDALLMMWALWNADAQVQFWFVPMTGRTFAWLLVFMNVLFGLASGGLPGLLLFTPHFAAMAIAYVAVRGRFPTRRWRMQWADFWAERAFKRRSRHLKVVRKNGTSGSKEWLN
jgi:membrane associated rhomboid family serine protease